MGDDPGAVGSEKSGTGGLLTYFFRPTSYAELESSSFVELGTPESRQRRVEEVRIQGIEEARLLIEMWQEMEPPKTERIMWQEEGF